MLRAKGLHADATNQFDRLLEDYDVGDVDVMVFGGMVPADTKGYLHAEISERHPGVTFVQGLAGIPGLIAAQVESVTGGESPSVIEISYDGADRVLRVQLAGASQVSVEAFWMTSFAPPEPTSTSMRLLEGDLPAGTHHIRIPDGVPSEASFATVTVDSQVRAFTIGALPEAVTRLVPTSLADRRLPEVAAVTTHSEEQ